MDAIIGHAIRFCCSFLYYLIHKYEAKDITWAIS